MRSAIGVAYQAYFGPSTNRNARREISNPGRLLMPDVSRESLPK